jgi:hypothetical protein
MQKLDFFPGVYQFSPRRAKIDRHEEGKYHAAAGENSFV